MKNPVFFLLSTGLLTALLIAFEQNVTLTFMMDIGRLLLVGSVALLALALVFSLTTKKVLIYENSAYQFKKNPFGWRLLIVLLAFIFWLVLVGYLSGVVFLQAAFILIALNNQLVVFSTPFILLGFLIFFYIFSRSSLVIPAAIMQQTYSFTSAWQDSKHSGLGFAFYLTIIPLLSFLYDEFIDLQDTLYMLWVQSFLISLGLMYVSTGLAYHWLSTHDFNH